VRGGRYYDPLPVFGALGMVTSSIRFAAHVLVLGYHHPLAIAKRYGTLDVVTGGRAILGVGVGSLQEEFELLGVPFADRGARADDSMRTLRAALSQREYEGLILDPCAVQPHVPLWVGGRTFRSLRRAVALGDGWAPFGLSRDEMAAMLARVELPADFDVLLQPEQPLDPIAEPEQSRDTLAGLAAIGATGVNLRFVHHSPAHYMEQLAALVD
jgi:alkanesulfonate monooxygenase SsuD/methylene tetrahydromethanopterin reductase-like flavin-dependent oxidoreductase (luciferase family)